MNIITKDTKDKGNTPKDIIMIKKIIEKEGIHEYEKNCLNFLNDFLNNYISSTLEESILYAKMCNRSKPNLEDIKLAVKLKKENNFTKKPSTSILKNTSMIINGKNLPNIPQGVCQLNLPLLESSQLKNNFQIFSEDITNNIEKKANTIDNWFHSNTKVENVTRIKQKGLSLSKKKMMKNQAIQQNLNTQTNSITANNDNSIKNLNSNMMVNNINNINNSNKKNNHNYQNNKDLNHLNLKEVNEEVFYHKNNYNQEDEYDYDN